MSDEVKLLPCPFCGAEAEMQPWHGGGPDKQLVGCSEHSYECPVGPSVTGETPEEAAAAWNTRAIEATRPPIGTDEVVERVARATCNIPPQGWWCSREARHDGPCAARPMALDQARWFAMNVVDVGPERPSRAKWSSLRSLGQQVLRRLEMLGKLPSTGPTPSGHEPDCDWHCEQYPWECTCGLTAAAMKGAASD